MLKFVLRESFLYTLANYTGVIANLFITPLITPMLRPEDYAILALFHAVAGALSPLGDLGLISLFQNAFFTQKDGWKKSWNSYLGFLLIYRILYATIAILVIGLVVGDEIPREDWLEIGLLILIPMVIFDIIRVVGMRLCQWQHHHRRVHITTAITGLCAVLVSLYTIRYLGMGYRGWFYSLFVAALIQFVSFAHVLFVKEKLRPQFNFPLKFIKQRLKVALPVIPHQSSSFLLDTSDRLMLKFMNFSMGQIGLYSIAYSFGLYFNNFNGQMGAVLSPIYFQIYGENKPEGQTIIRSITWIWLSMVLVGGFLLSLWVREIFQFLYRNDELSIAYPYSIFIIMALCYRPMYTACVDRIIFEEKTKTLLKISLAAGLINVVLNLILIPIYGIEGAVFTTFFSYMYMGFAGYFLKDTRKYITVNYHPFRGLALIIMCTFAAYYCVELPVLWKIAITAFVIIMCVAGYFVFGRKLVAIVNAYQIKKS
ncbi:MAG: O-antigen/teichoic acid export membrane protein [Flavobacteriales bacterium]|jgi:O-antigen/teichoic acid export membrane protein